MFEPKTKGKLQNAVNELYKNKRNAFKKYGYIITWNVSNITDMRSLFLCKKNFMMIFRCAMFPMSQIWNVYLLT